MSGIPHHDIGNYTRSSFWKAGRPRGMRDHPTWARSIDVVLGRLARERVDAYLHTGDMVGGKWGVDHDRPRAGIVGPYGNVERDGVPRTHQYKLIRDFRAAWRDHFVAGRGYRRLTEGQQRHGAYATVLPGRVGLVTLEPLLRTNGRLVARIGPRQEAWLTRTLRALREDGSRYLIVQSEVPLLAPNRARHSSRLILRNVERIYDICARAGVDLILSGEFHAITTTTDRGRTPVQIVHGGQLYRAHVNYLVIDVFDDRLEITAKGMTGTRDRPSAFWAAHRQRAPGVLTMKRETTLLGRATLRDGRLINRSGYLTEGID
jgi:hypothetical protein